MPKSPDYRARTLAVASRVGGAQGRALSAMVAALSRPAIGTKTLVGAQVDSVKAFLGAFVPDAVPISVKKKMLRHAQVRYSSAASKAPILNAELYFETNSVEAQALCQRVFIDSGFLRRTMRSSLDAIDYGFAAHEQVWDVEDAVTVEWDMPAPEGKLSHRTANYPLLFVPREAKDLDPSSVALLRDQYGSLIGVVFNSPGLAITSEDISAALADPYAKNVLAKNKFFVFTLDGRWQNHYGVGRLDSVYDPWYWQTLIYLICNRWFERKGDPPYVGYAPSNAALADPGLDATAYDPASESESPVLLMSRALDKLRSTGNLSLPSDPYYDEQGKPSNLRAYEVKEIDTKDAHPAFLQYIEHLDAKIARGYFVPDAVVAGQRGTSQGYGSLQVLADVYVQMENDILASWVERVNEDFIKPFLDYNGVKDRVTLKTSGVTAANRESLKATFAEILKADTLAEQAFGRIYPQSVTAMVDRTALMRANGIPFMRPDPDAPAPQPPQSPETAAAGAAKGAAGQPQRGPAKKAASVHVKMTEKEWVAHKVPTIIREGVRGRKVTPEQAVAIAHSMYKQMRAKAKHKKTMSSLLGGD